jgi:hypothetical protein
MARGVDPFEQRLVFSADVLDGTVDLDAYPHRYLLVHADTGMSASRQAIPRLLAAIEVLEDQEWELVNVLARDTLYAIVRRPAA